MTKAIRRVIVATDFSGGSLQAVERAVQLARAHGARLELLHAFDPGAWQSLRAVFDLKRLASPAASDSERRQRLSDEADRLAALHGLQVEPQLVVGAPASAIEARVKATHAALVVLARRSEPTAPGVSSTLLRVLRQAPCPLLVVRSAATGAYERVMTAVDLREVSLRAAAEAVRVFPKAAHRLLYVVDPQWEQEVRRGRAEAEPLGALLQSLHAQATQRLEALAQQLRQGADGAVSVEVEVIDAIAARGIVERASAWAADCVVVGRHGQGLVADTLLGSTALDAIHHTAGDVLVVP